MTLFESAILGFFQGITEFLPISSSGHLSILRNFFEIDEPYLELDITLHLASFIAVIFFFRNEIKSIRIQKSFFGEKFRYLLFILVATLPIIIAGPIYDYFILESIDSFYVTIAGFLFSGVVLIFVDKFKKISKSKELNYIPSLLVGFSQILALLPGISRSGITISAGLLLGLDRNTSVRFSIFIGSLAILSSSVYLLLKTMIGESLDISPINLIFSGTIAFVTSLLGIKILVFIVKNTKLWVFGIYCIVLSFITYLINI